jgi:hypothetical protein
MLHHACIAYWQAVEDETEASETNNSCENNPDKPQLRYVLTSEL